MNFLLAAVVLKDVLEIAEGTGYLGFKNMNAEKIALYCC